MIPFTLIMAYYENPGMLREHVRAWRKLPWEIREHLNVIVIDDGSPTAPATELELGWNGDGMFLASFQLWRMGVDVRWNQDACRNVGVREAKTTWLLLTDMDHVVPEATWRTLMWAKLNKHRAYRFQRVNAPAGDAYKPHPNSWALTRGLYWRIGGYDEALAGNYGTDGDFLVRARRVADVVEFPAPIVRYPREVIPDASTTSLTRKSEADKQNVTRIVKARVENPGWRPLHFSFPCERVL